MDGQLKIYDPDQVTISICGIPVLGGHADGEFFRMARATDSFSDKVGTTGEVVRSKNNDKRADCTLVVMRTAACNPALSALVALDEDTPGGAGVGAILVNDLLGNTIFEGTGWIKKPADASLDREATMLEWPIRVATIKILHGAGFVVG